MNSLELQKILKYKNISFKIKDNIIIIDENNIDIYLFTIKVINCKIIFNNKGYVVLSNLTKITSNLIFNNEGFVNLKSLTKITSKVKFNNKGNIYLNDLKESTTNIKFNNTGFVDLENLKEMTSNIIFNNTDGVYFKHLNEYDVYNLGFNRRKIKIYNHLTKGYVTSLGCFVGTLAECIYRIENNKFYINRPELKNNYIEGLKLAFSKYN